MQTTTQGMGRSQQYFNEAQVPLGMGEMRPEKATAGTHF